MAQITFKGNPATTSGNLPSIGTTMKEFKLVKSDLSELTLSQYAGKNKILNIFPSIDTGVCATSVRKFNQEAANIPNTVVINISADLPFAQKRFCGAEGINNVETASTFRSEFGKENGLLLLDTPLAGLLSRCVIVLDKENKVLYTEQVSDIVNEPNYQAAIQSVK